MAQTFMYRSVKGEVEAKIFDSDDLPKSGWHDNPDDAAKAKAKKAKAQAPAPPKVKKKRNRAGPTQPHLAKQDAGNVDIGTLK